MSVGTPASTAYFGGQSEERPLIPLVDTMAATIDQVPPQRFHENATHAANGRQRACRLLGLGAIATTLDRTLLCDVLGATVEWDADAERYGVDPGADPSGLTAPSEITEAGRVPVVLDVADRLVATLDDVAVLGGIPGPVATQAALHDDATITSESVPLIRDTIGDLARAYGRTGVDAFLVVERATDHQPIDAVVDIDVDTLDMLGNVAAYFGIPLLLVPDGYDVDVTERIVEEAPVDAVFLDTADPVPLAEAFPETRVGGGLTPELLDASTDEIEATVRSMLEHAPESVFVASGTEVPPGTHPEKLHAVRRVTEAVAS